MVQSLAWVMPITHQWCHGMLSQEYRNAEHTNAEHRNAEILKRKIQQNWLVLPINTWVQSLPWLLPNPSPKTLSRPSLVVIQSIGNCRRDICKGGSIFSLWLQQLDMSQGVFEFISWDWFRWRWQWVTRRWRSKMPTIDEKNIWHTDVSGRSGSPDKITTNELICAVLNCAVLNCTVCYYYLSLLFLLQCWTSEKSS